MQVGHSSHSANRRSLSRLASRAGLAAALVVLAAAVGAASAAADGDPASDVLAQQPLFLPQDASIAPGQQAQLAGLIEAAAHNGYPIRVALIASSADLGSVTELWRQPQSYAKFLGQELALMYRGPLLIVMPNGLGFYSANGGSSSSALKGVEQSSLGTTAISAIQRLAAASGHQLPIAAATVPSSASTSDVTPWIVFAAGAVMIALAWAASLRARPLSLAAPGRRARAGKH